MELYGEKIKKETILRHTGDPSQICDARESVMTSGKADGVRIIEVKTGSGLSFTVVPSRSLDIAWADYKGTPISYISKTGMVAPAYFEKDGFSYLRSFYCGLMSTCGLTYMGAPCTDAGEDLGLHGRIGNTPAEDVSVFKGWEEDEYVIRIRGKVRESRVFKENLQLSREITVKMGGKSIGVRDSVENCGFDEQPFMLLYHNNFGYPIVSEDTVLITPPATVSPRDKEAEKGMDRYARFEKPTHGYSEQVFYHDIEPAKDGGVFSCLFNEKLGLGAYVKFNKKQLPYLVEWKMMGEGDYVVGMETGMWKPEGRCEARRQGVLQTIKPGEIRHFDQEFGIVENKKEIDSIL